MLAFGTHDSKDMCEHGSYRGSPHTMLAIAALASWTSAAQAWECAGYEAYQVEPGGAVEVAPRNTQIFVSLTPGWHYVQHEGPQVDHGWPDQIVLLSLRGQPLRRWRDAGTPQVPLETLRDFKPTKNKRSVRVFEFHPIKELEPAVRYAVVALAGKTRWLLSNFVVADVLDKKAPRFGVATETQKFVPRDVSGPGGKQLEVRVTWMEDDRTPDLGLRLVVTGPSEKPRGNAPAAILLPQPMWQGVVASAHYDADCYPDSIRLEQDAPMSGYSVTVVDLAGNVSKTVPLRSLPPEPLGSAATTKVEPPRLHVLPGLGFVRRGRVLRWGIAAVLVLALVVMVRVVLLLRRRRS